MTMLVYFPRFPCALHLTTFLFRQDTALSVITPSTVDSTDAPFARSIRGPSEAELLRQNPFKNYSAHDLNLSSVDPLIAAAAAEGLKKKGGKKAAEKLPNKLSTSSSKSSSSSSNTVKASATASAKTTGAVTEKVACPLALIYPSPGVEISLEELKMKSRIEYTIEVETWKGWKWRKEWKAEMEETGRESSISRSITIPIG